VTEAEELLAVCESRVMHIYLSIAAGRFMVFAAAIAFAFQLYVLDADSEVEKIMGVKNYYINIIIQYNHDDEESLKRYRVGFNRDEINSIKEINML
jgi:translation elongation factor EF-Ts